MTSPNRLHRTMPMQPVAGGGWLVRLPRSSLFHRVTAYVEGFHGEWPATYLQRPGYEWQPIGDGAPMRFGGVVASFDLPENARLVCLHVVELRVLDVLNPVERMRVLRALRAYYDPDEHLSG